MWKVIYDLGTKFRHTCRPRLLPVDVSDMLSYKSSVEMGNENEYVCTLDDASLKKAIEELNEDPKNRLGAVETLRSWVLQQPHFICRPDTAFLLRFLRFCKFSQLEARKRLETYLTLMTQYYDWIADIDVYAPEIVNVLKCGYMVPLPGRDIEGRRIVLLRLAAFDPKTTTSSALIRACGAILYLLLRDENVFVNGYVYLIDFTGMELKHRTFFSLEDMRKQANLFRNALPARIKGFHYYNMGPVAEAMWQVALPFMGKKLRERVTMHGSNLESVYRVFPMEVLPEEYLPDDYTGTTAGPLDDMINSLISQLQEPELARYIATMSDRANYSVNESKRPLKDNSPQESFRSLKIE